MAHVDDLLAKRAALEQQQTDLDKQIREARKAERSKVIGQIQALMADHDLTIDDLKKSKRGPKARAGKKPSGKVAAKFRDNATGNAWSGRGLQPNWLKAALAKGKKLQDFAV